MGVKRFERPQHKQQVYSLPRLSYVGAHPGVTTRNRTDAFQNHTLACTNQYTMATVPNAGIEPAYSAV